MRPIDYQDHNNPIIEYDSINYRIKQSNLRNPLTQPRFDVHDCYNIPSCFKKGPECRTDLPQKH